MAAMTGAPTHEGPYRNTPLILGGLLGAIAVLFGGTVLALQLASGGNELMHMLFATLGLFVLTFLVCMLPALRRHAWTIEADAVRITERPSVPLAGARRAARIPFDQIAALGRVQNMRDELLAITTRDGRRFLLPPAVVPGDGPIGRIDQAGLAAFAEELRAAMARAGAVPPPVVDALGFWNSGAGLALLAIAFLASLVLAALALWALFEGEANGGRRSGEAVGLLVLLPVGLGWLLRSAVRRRSAVRAARR
jgi:hypothetical protein